MKQTIFFVILILPLESFCQQILPNLKRADTIEQSFTTASGNKIAFFGSSALSGQSSDFSNSLTATGKFSVVANVWKDFYVGLGANLLNVNPAKTKKDSVDINSLMFPETGNFGVLVTPSYKFKLGKSNGTDNYFLIPFFEFAYRKVSIDSPQIYFKVYNYTTGLNLEWNYTPDEKNSLTLRATPYFHSFHIPVEDVKNFKTIMNDSLFVNSAKQSKTVNLQSFGLKITLQYNNFVFFADFRKNNKTDNLSDGDPFKGGAVNIGFTTYFKIASF